MQGATFVVPTTADTIDENSKETLWQSAVLQEPLDLAEYHTGTIEDNAPVVTIEDTTIAGAGGFPVMSNPSATGHHSCFRALPIYRL
jgi:hypothetical protein